MFRKINDVLAKHLQMNMDSQDFYKDPYTELCIDSKLVMDFYPTIVFRHPLYVLDSNQENVFPKRAQLDVDREFEPAIALVVTFSMKENKQELDNFRSMPVFTEFVEIKDFGVRFYAIDCGTNIQKAISVSADIIKNVFNGEKAQAIQIISHDAIGEEMCADVIQLRKLKTQKTVKPKKNAQQNLFMLTNTQITCPHCGSRLVLSKELENTYYLQCNICGGEFANPLNPIGNTENWLNKHKVLWFCMIIVVMIAIAAIFMPEGGSNKAVATLGDDIVISTKTFGAIDEQAFEELNDAMLARDQRGIAELIFYDRVGALDVGTEGKIIKRNFGKARIRLKDGRAFWVNSDFIKPIN